MSIYERVGGADAIDAAVDIFYTKVLADDAINEFFDIINMPAQIEKQKYFLKMALGGPHEYTGRDLREAHKGMNLNEDHFTSVATHLVATLEELEVSQDLIDEIVTVVASTKDDILYQ